jgi:hypothetical protein
MIRGRPGDGRDAHSSGQRGLSRSQASPHVQRSVPPCHASRPPFMASAAITSAGTGSAHHQPTVALSTRPTRRTTERYVHSSVWLLSATTLPEPRRRPLRRFSLASRGHHNEGHGGKRDADRAGVRFASAGEIEHGLHGHVAPEGEEAHRDEPQRLFLAVLGKVTCHLPDDDRS